ncbi:MAG: hypothetical protein JWQ38_1161 [Flavipsychrobacter sp.]|nr:hypothetical protein [Flavipsychrobacter sp.]
MLSSCKDETPWAQYTNKEAGFTVFMPAHPVKSDKKAGKQVIHFITWKPTTFALDKFKLFEVSYTDFPGVVVSDSNSVNAILDTAISQRKKDFTELDVDSQPIILNGYPGRAFMYQAPRGNTITIVKECMVGNRRYDLTVIAKENYSINNEMNAFFNSFQVLR